MPTQFRQWLGYQESNLEWLNQNQLCCQLHHTPLAAYNRWSTIICELLTSLWVRRCQPLSAFTNRSADYQRLEAPSPARGHRLSGDRLARVAQPRQAAVAA